MAPLLADQSICSILAKASLGPLRRRLSTDAILDLSVCAKLAMSSFVELFPRESLRKASPRSDSIFKRLACIPFNCAFSLARPVAAIANADPAKALANVDRPATRASGMRLAKATKADSILAGLFSSSLNTSCAPTGFAKLIHVPASLVARPFAAR